MRIAGYFSAYRERMHCLRVCGENIGLAMEEEHGGKKEAGKEELRKEGGRLGKRK
jgi:hypothetical protein